MPTTHDHLVKVVAREARLRNLIRPVILDAGCGDGRLVEQIAGAIDGELYGFDSAEYGFIADDRLVGARERLRRLQPAVDWQDRIRVSRKNQAWPFDNGAFDMVVSNQVCEHVEDLEAFFAECFRVLRIGGVAIHLFPLRHVAAEVHLQLPFVHRVRSHDLRVSLIAAMSRLGLGKYRLEAKPLAVTVPRFAAEHADYVWFFTRYRTWRQVAEAARSCGFRASYRYTSGLYIRRLLGRRIGALTLPTVAEMLAFPLLRTLASATILLEKEQSYKPTWQTGHQ